MAVQETRIALRNLGKINPQSIEDYIAVGGYEALKKAKTIDQDQLINEIENASKLRGRGGAGFNTGFKWSGARASVGDKKYIVCNGDEGEPGTFKDRVIIENDPHTVIEGMLIAAYAVGANEAVIYCRGEYEEQIELLKHAIAQAEEKGMTDGVKVRVVSGAGSYVCGEETALLNSIEEKRAEPRLKPPFPTVKGLYGKPTVVNNVETYANVPAIVLNGADWFAKIGSEKYPGTKIFSVSGDIKNPGCYEMATDASLDDIVIGLAGGPKDGHTLKAIQLGGSSCGYIKGDEISLSIDFDSLRASGKALGSGAILALDETHNMVDQVQQILHFFAHESCGKCTPCREGLFQSCKIIDKFAKGEGTKEDLAMLLELYKLMAKDCFCPLGQGALTAFKSAYENFPEDFAERMVK
ncbi:NADH dehydrogenase (quinone) [Lachnospiraceae bacterium TWA4]|nr:NADH dehydrogenase (quinone) [Lachnospiraceae bacterium TWA4]